MGSRRAVLEDAPRTRPIGWKEKFRAKLEDDLIGKDLMFLMGNQHRFQDQWLIISLFYPPRQKPVDDPQMPLL